MSKLFEPGKIGGLQIRNRFVHSATYENLAREDGVVTDAIVDRYRNLARGGIGLVIPGFMFILPGGNAIPRQIGIHSDDMIPGLRRLSDAVHAEGGLIAFQIAHAGRQTTRALSGREPMGPSSVGRDPANFVRPREMNEADIEAVIEGFGRAAARAGEAGADAIQISAAHGYLVNQFLSPFLNRRTDRWGGSTPNAYRFLGETLAAIRRATPGLPLMVKLSTNDFTPGEGVTPGLARDYAALLRADGIDAVEVSAGTINYSMFNMIRGGVPVSDMVRGLPGWKKPLGYVILTKIKDRYGFDEPYNLAAARLIKPALGDTPLILVGGVRKVADMERIVAEGNADFIAMSRPFIREPHLVKRIAEGKTDAATCVSCNRCCAAMLAGFPIRCYREGLPKRP